MIPAPLTFERGVPGSASDRPAVVDQVAKQVLGKLQESTFTEYLH